MVAVLAVYALVAGIQGSTNGISVNEEKRGKGTVDTLSFKNPVTIRLIDKDGNVVAEEVTYNAILNAGRNVIYEALDDGSISPINGIAAVDSSGGGVVTTGVFVRDSTPVDLEGTYGAISCDPEVTPASGSGPGNITCTVTFDVVDFTVGSTAETIDLASTRKLQMGVVDTSSAPGSVTAAYFEINNGAFPDISVSDVTVAEIQVSWQVSIP